MASPSTGFLIPNGTTPEQIATRQQLAAAMLRSGMDTSPIASPWQGAARLAQALFGGATIANTQTEADSERAKAMAGLLQAVNGQATTTSPPDAGGTIQPKPMTAASVSTGPTNYSKTGMFDPGDTEMQAGLITPVKYQPDVLDAAKKNNIDPLMYAKQLRQESGFNPDAVSPKGATGVAQFMPATAAERGVNPADPASSIAGGASYFADLKKQFNGDDKLALMAYNWGPKNVQNWIASGADPNKIPAETRDYVQKILGGGSASPSMASTAIGPTPPPQTSVAPPVQGGVPAGTFGLIKAASNPWLGAGGQAIIGKVLEKQLTPRDQFVSNVDANGVPFQTNLTTGEKKADPTRDTAINEVEYARRNWQQLGFPNPTSAEPKDQNFWKEYNAKRLGGAGVNVQIDQSAPSEFEKTYGTGVAKMALGTLEDGPKAQSDLNNIQLTKMLLQNVKTGKLANASASLGSVMQAFDIDPSKFGLDPKLPATQEALTSLVNNMTLGKIGAATGGMPANNFSDADRSFLQRIMPGLANRPEANDIILEAGSRVAQLRMDKSNAWADARAGEWDKNPGKKMSYEEFDRMWRKDSRNVNMFADLADKVKALDAGAQGTTAPQGKPDADGWITLQNGVRIRQKQ